MNKYSKITENDVLKLFETQAKVTHFDICNTYNCSIYEAKKVVSGMDLKITNWGFKLK